jgi:outer membrane protein OmpA-like peptidoglycan-associated protein
MNLLDILKDQVSGSLVSQASSFLGADESNISKAVDGIFPALLGKMISGSEETGGAQKIFDMASNMDGGMLDNIGDLFGGGADNVAKLMNSGSGVLNLLLGSNTGGIIEKIADFAGLKGSAASSLIKMAAPFLMSAVGKYVKEQALDAVGLGKFLDTQKSVVKNAMPGGLLSALGAGFLGKGMSAVMGLANDGMDAGKSVLTGAAGLAGDAVGTGKDSVTEAINVAGDAADLGKKAMADVAGMAGDAADTAVKTGGSLLKWLLPALLALLVLGYFGKSGCNAVDDAAAKVSETTTDVAKGAATMAGDAAGTVGDVTGDVAGAVGNAASKVGDAVASAFGNIDAAAKKLLDDIKFTAGSVGDQMTKFISDGMKGDARFRFNNLNFATGSAVIDAASRVEIDNLAAIMKAYPDLKIQITGYTDNTGDAANNQQLSQARAVSVKGRLIQQSISGSRIATEGKGPADPVASNGTEGGRAENRRIEVTILK